MSRPSIKTIVNMDVADNKRRLMQSLSTLTGLYEVEIQPRRNLRSLRQNSYYWAACVTAFAQYLNEQNYEITTKDEAHALLAAKFLVFTVMDPNTGEPIGRLVRSTTTLDTQQFSEYVERVRTWLAEFFGIITPDPGEYGVDVPEPSEA